MKDKRSKKYRGRPASHYSNAGTGGRADFTDRTRQHTDTAETDNLRREQQGYQEQYQRTQRRMTDAFWEAMRERRRREQERRRGYAEPKRTRTRTCPHEILAVACASTHMDLRKAYRTAALKEHPDRGGTHEGMKALNATAEILGVFDGGIEASSPSPRFPGCTQ